MHTLLVLVLALAGCVVSTKRTPDPPKPTPVSPHPYDRAARADEILGSAARTARKVRVQGGITLTVSGALAGASAVVAIVTPARGAGDVAGGILIGTSAAMIAYGIYVITTTTPEESLHREFKARAAVDSIPAVAASEPALAAIAARRRTQLRIVRWCGLGVVAAGIAGIAYGPDAAARLVGGFGVVFGGIVALSTLRTHPTEAALSRWRVELGAAQTAGGRRVPTAGIGWRF